MQGVAGCFIVGSGPRIELLENLSGSVMLTPWIEAGVKMYHLAYRVNDLMGALEWGHSQRAKVVVQPVQAVGFSGCRIAFMMLRNSLMLEFIEKPPAKA